LATFQVNRHLHAIKEQALERTAPADAGKPGRYKPGDSLLAFLENL